MSCVNYWTCCNDCKNEHYDYSAKESCPECGSKNVDHIREWDEEGSR